MKPKKPENACRRIVESAPDGIYVASERGLEFINEAFEKITGISRGEIRALGLGYLEFIHPEDRKQVINARKARNAGRQGQGVLKIRIRRGRQRTRHLELRIGPIPGPGKLMVGIIRDVTGIRQAQKKQQALEDRIKTMFDKAKEGILIVQDSRIGYVNPAIEALSGFGRKDLLAQPVARFIARKPAGADFDIRRRILSGDPVPFSFEMDLETKSGVSFQAGLQVMEIGYRRRNAFLVVIRNLLKEKEMEVSLSRAMESLRSVLGATVQAMSRIIEQRDPYTAGHQRRVAELSRAMALEIGLSPDQVEAVHMSGLLHDIGKISIPSEILTKPTALTDAEFSLIKTHPEAAFEILKTIDFPWPIADIIHQHHERIDGSGYPLGLKEDGILPEAKILAVADVVEAMITHRPYREARRLEEALDEISRFRGVLYDRRAVDACLAAFRDKGFTFKTD